MTEDKIVKALHFSSKDPYAEEALVLLDKAGKKQAKLVSIMAHDFMARYGISTDISRKDLIKLMEAYQLLKNINTNPMYIPYNFPQIQQNNAQEKQALDDKVLKKNKKNSTKQKEIQEEEVDLSELDYALSDFQV